MFGPRLNTVFASRWKALLWSACILMTAYCSIPAAEDTPEPPHGTFQQMADQLEQPKHHKSPWDRDAR